MTNNFYPCAYYNINDIPLNKSNSKSLNIFHFNIRSLPKNYDLLHEFLCILPISPEIICLSESRINHQPLSNLDLPGYKLFHNDSATRAGGVAIYVNNNICAELIPQLVLDIDGCENLWLKLDDADVVISAIYRHPKNNSKLFLDHLNNSLAHNMLKNTKVYLVGDFNIDIASTSSAPNFATDFINLLASNGYFPLVTLPTRVTETSSTVIDHIITNDHKHSIIPGIIKSD